MWCLGILSVVAVQNLSVDQESAVVRFLPMSKQNEFARLNKIISDLAIAFERQNGRPPTTCHLTRDDEDVLFAAPDSVTAKASDVYEKGVRGAFKTLFGFTIVWGAEKTAVS